MHPNPAFRKPDADHNIAFARKRGFGLLTLNADPAPLISHIPFVLNKAGDQADLHLVRSNPILRLLDDPRPAVIAVSGADAYISPDWYGIQDQVPTWNYVAVHLRGQLERLPQDYIRSSVDALAAQFEARLAPKPPWVTDKMTPDVLDKMLRMIVPCQFRIEEINGTWKLGQNKPEPARMGAADGVEAQSDRSNAQGLAALLRNPPSEGDPT